MRNRRAQTTAEYAVLIAVVVGALLAMQIYVKRGAMGRLKDAADQVGEQFTPLNTQTKAVKTYAVTREEQTFAKGKTTSTITSKDGESQKSTGGYVRVEQSLSGETVLPK